MMSAAAPATTTTTTPDRPTTMGGNNNNAADHGGGIEALRQRGLAKLLNKHFTETTKKLATEKAAADAALRDLEARKASNGGEASSSIAEGISPAAAGVGGLDNDNEDDPLDSLYTSVHQWRNECRRKERETLLLYQRYVHKFGSTGNVKLPPASSPSDRAAAAADAAAVPPFSPDAASAKPGVPPPTDSPRHADSPPAVMIPTSRVPTASTSNNHAHHHHLSSDYLAAPVVPTSAGGDAEFRNFYRRQLEARKSGSGGAAMKIVEDEPIAMDPNIFDPFMPTILGAGGDDDGGDDDEDDDISMISGLTSVNSAMTKQILNDCEQTVVTFLQEEKKAIKVLMDKEMDDSQSHKTNPSALGSIQSHAAQEAENMAKKMQEILHDFQTKADQDKETAEKKGEGRPYETSNPEEKWAVYYDESYQREYYHESNTNKTQWEPPEQTSSDMTSHSTSTEHDDEVVLRGSGSSSAHVGKAAATASSSSAILESIDVMPEVHERVSRIALYRRKRRRQRKRRVLLGVACVMLMTAFGLYHAWSTNPEMVRGWVAKMDNVLHTDMAGMKTKEQQEQERKAREAKIAAAEAAARETRLAKEAKAKAAEEARQREIKRREEEERTRQQELAKAEAERIAAEAKAAAEAERIAAEERKKELHRPWGCNIPLAYIVNGRCRRLADANPIYDPLNEFMPLD